MENVEAFESNDLNDECSEYSSINEVLLLTILQCPFRVNESLNDSIYEKNPLNLHHQVEEEEDLDSDDSTSDISVNSKGKSIIRNGRRLLTEEENREK